MLVATEFVLHSKANLREAKSKLNEVVVPSRFVHLGKAINIVLSEEIGHFGPYFKLTVKAMSWMCSTKKPFRPMCYCAVMRP